jgi:CSLREA domain-containing protein
LRRTMLRSGVCMRQPCTRIWVRSLPLMLATSRAIAATIVVNSTADTALDDGHCTLREAIAAANSNTASGGTAGECIAGGTGTDTIEFNIADAGCVGGPPKICTIAPSTPLPGITAPVAIDGYATQTGASANTLAIGDGDDAVILIRLDASGVTGTALHLAAGSDGSTLRGLSVVRPGGDAPLGYMVKIDSSNVTVAGNFIGVEPDGATVSTHLITFDALDVSGNDNIIGGTLPAARNLIANTTSQALWIERGTSHLVQGNYFDLDATGTVAIGNAQYAIDVATGGNTIGGSVAGAGNVIGAWGLAGLQFSSNSFNPGAASAQGNRIGTDASGTVGLAAGPYGIVIGGSSGTVTIGGGGAGEGNLIRGAQNGIYVNGDAAAGTPVIQGNRIGVGLDGAPLPSGTSGIVVANSSGGLIGGTAANEGNVIGCNGTNAVAVSFATGWAVLGNSIYGNGFGISLAGSDNISPPTQNDLNDADTGNNNLQNYPVISSVTIESNTAVQISGNLNSEASKTYRLEFFANARCDKSHNGQGKDFIGFKDVTTSVTNNIPFGPLPFVVPAGRHVITATATDPNGNTSEFSLCSDQDAIFSDGFETASVCN